MDLVGILHAFLEGGHAFGHSSVVHATGVEVECLEGLGAHAGLLGHGGRRPAENAPFGLLHAPVEDRLEDADGPLEILLREIGRLEYIFGTTQGDIGVHGLHAVHFPR